MKYLNTNKMLANGLTKAFFKQKNEVFVKLSKLINISNRLNIERKIKNLKKRIVKTSKMQTAYLIDKNVRIKFYQIINKDLN